MDYRITIDVSGVGGVYSAKDYEEAKEIAQSICDDVYMKLDGKCSVEIGDIDLA